MKARPPGMFLTLAAFCAFCASTASADESQDLVNDTAAVAEAELREQVMSIANDIMAPDIEGLQAAHLVSDKFTKFGPRKFERQDVNDANASEAAFFSSISDVGYRINDLKIDLFGDIGIVTYYPHVSFVREGESKTVDGRQTLVFLRTNEGWKIVHEHGTVRPRMN